MNFVTSLLFVFLFLNVARGADLPKRLKCESVGESFPKIELDVLDMSCFYIHCLQMDPATRGSVLAIWKQGESSIYEINLFYPHKRQVEKTTVLENDSRLILEGVCKDCIQEVRIALSNKDTELKNWKGQLRFVHVKWLNRSSSVVDLACQRR